MGGVAVSAAIGGPDRPIEAMRPRGATALLLLACLLLGLGGCADMPRYHNSDGQRLDKPWGEVLRWTFTRDRSAADRPLALPVRHEPRATAPAQPGELSVTWVGHATVLLRIGGANLLTDPQFSDRASPVSWAGPERRTPMPFAPQALPHIDVVLISHNHYDHLDEASILLLQRQPGGPPLFVVPLGVEAWFHAQGIDNVRPLGWWQSLPAAGLTLHGVPARHWSARGLFDRHRSHWSGWVVESANGQRVYFAGDTGYGDGSDFRRIGARFPALDLALIPVGAYEPRWFMREQHVDPPEAVAIHRDLGARRSLGIHWGTFVMSDEALDAPLTALPAARRAQGVADEDFRLLEHGQTWEIVAPPAAAPAQAAALRPQPGMSGSTN